MIILSVLFILLSIPLSLLFMVLLIPFGYKIKAVCTDQKSIWFKAYWLFGLIAFSGHYDGYQGFGSEFTLLGLRMKSEKKEASTKVKSKAEKPKKKEKKKSRIISADGIKAIWLSCRKIISHILPRKIVGYGRLGFDDPYYTALTCSIVEGLRSTHFHDISLDYVFNDEVYEGELFIEGRIFLIHIVYIALRLYFNKPARKLIFH